MFLHIFRGCLTSVWEKKEIDETLGCVMKNGIVEALYYGVV